MTNVATTSTAIQRTLSVSTISDTTVNSSLVNRLILENNTANNFAVSNGNFVRDLDVPTQTNVSIEGSSGVRVGDVYNFYGYQNPLQALKSHQKRTNSDQSDQNEIFRTPEKRSKFFILKHRKIIMASVLVVIISIIVGLLVYFLLPKKNFDEATTIETTTNETTEGPTDPPTPPLTTTNGTTTTTERTTTTTGPTTSEAPHPEFYVERSEWTEDPLHEDLIPLQTFPIKRIIVGQTGTQTCESLKECKSTIQNIRSDYSGLLDIPWNFLIGGDGRVYEGRGYRHQGEHSKNWNATDYNDIGIGVAFIGDFRSDAPSTDMKDALNKFVDQSLNDGNFSIDYLAFFQDQLIYKEFEAVELKNALVEVLDEKFYSIQRIYKREEWGAIPVSYRPSDLFPMANPLERVILNHGGVDWTCADEAECSEITRRFQTNAINSGNDNADITYNFLVGGEGNFGLVLEGRGFSHIGAHTGGRNTGSLGIGLIGHFDLYAPGPALMNSLKIFIDDAVALGKLKANYEIHFWKDYHGGTSPGTYVTSIVQNWPHFAIP